MFLLRVLDCALSLMGSRQQGSATRNAFHASFRSMTPSTSTFAGNCCKEGRPDFDFQPKKIGADNA